ncbi:hypothetical protein KC19_3G061700 [Ceratodon purpureus]|uniref:DNA replication licensing factor MCM3 n=1 Tax=Ceratodon purpureus TaxID=3225 RepID=A0A8T0IFG3_CERPU|nr:hypothetical protein KC19_3G061700 [Ceratodon purpureus]
MDEMGQGVYMEKIRNMFNTSRKRLLVDLTDLRDHDPDLTRRLLQRPGELMQPFSEALDQAARNANPKYLNEEEEVLLGFEGPFGFHRLTPRELLSPFLGTLVSVEGIVTKCSLVRPKVVKSVHFCPTTGEFLDREYRDITSTSGLPTGSVYPTRDDHGNLLVTEFGLCKFRDHQTISIQEMPENSAPGQLPRSIDVIAEDDLVDICKPGDRVAIVGIFKAIPGANKGSMNGVFRTVLIANNISQLNKEISAPIFTGEDLSNIKKIGKRQDTFELLAESLAPSIYGHSWIKKAVVLQLLGGMEKNLKNGTHIRGDVNMMMVGDPSVAKSQLLRAIMNIAPLAISTTGRGSSGVGLTAAVTSDQETGERRLEAGAMVLADRGIVCIDEFDKMSDLDRVSIHEVMEQQTVTIAKAGIHASLNARCSVVAAANPIFGSYDRSLTPTKNIGLPDSLLSRFDLLFIVLDQMDADIDRQISEHVLRMHRYRTAGEDSGMPRMADARDTVDDEDVENGTAVFVKYNRLLHGEKRNTRQTKRDKLTTKFLKKYIHYAKSRIMPVLTEEASEQIAQTYAEMRNNNTDKGVGGGTLPVTARTLETIIRLSAAHAKLKLRNQVTKADVDAALGVMNFAIYHKELTDMDEREAERGREQEAQKKRMAENSNVDNEEDLSADNRRTPRKVKPRTSKSQGTPKKGGDIDMDDAEPISTDERLGEADDSRQDALDSEAPDSEEQLNVKPSIEVSPQRELLFQNAFSQHTMTNRLEYVQLSDLASIVNANNPKPFSAGEIDWVLQKMQAANRVMVAEDKVHLI